jgi:hypothetical protein
MSKTRQKMREKTHGFDTGQNDDDEDEDDDDDDSTVHSDEVQLIGIEDK